MISEEKIKKLQEILQHAGTLVMDFYQTTLDKQHKEDGSFATQADHASEAYLIKELSLLIIGSGFYAEESGITQGENEYMWVIDPLDGTSNFSLGIPYFCIAVALMYQNIPILGCIYNPITQELFYAQKGSGAYCNDVPIRVTNQKDMEQAIVAFELDYEHLALLNCSWHFSKSIRMCGASALDLAYCAAGRYDVTILTCFKWWDIAAGIILMQEAQGIAITFDEEMPVLSSKSLIAGNKFLVPLYLELIKDVNSI